MSKKFTAVVFLILTLAVVSWLTGAAVAVETEEKAARKAEEKKKLTDKEAQIGELKEKIQEIKKALERDQSAEKAKELNDSLKEYGQKLERLMAGAKKSPKPKGEFPDLERAINQTREQLAKLKREAKASKEEGAGPDKLEAMQKKIKQKEAELQEYTTLLEKRGADQKLKKSRERSKLVIVSLKHANAQSLSKVIEKFLTPSGIIAAHAETNSLIIQDSPAGLETARVIIKELDVGEKIRERGERRRRVERDRPRGERGMPRGERNRPRREGDRPRGERDMPRRERDRPRRDGVITGKVIKAGKEGLTVETEEGKVTFYVPVRKKEDGTLIPFEELSHHVSSLKAGSTVKVQWTRGDDSEKLWIRRVDTGEPRFMIGKVVEAGEKALTIETGEGKVTFYVPLRKREDGTRVPVKELSKATSALKVGSTVKVQWIRGEEKKKLWIQRLGKVEE